MQTAMILSDLKSLSVCNHQEALNLVTVNVDVNVKVHGTFDTNTTANIANTTSTTSTTSLPSPRPKSNSRARSTKDIPPVGHAPEPRAAASTVAASEDIGTSQADLQRVKDLLELHHSMKLKYMADGIDAELRKSRHDVNKVQEDLIVMDCA